MLSTTGGTAIQTQQKKNKTKKNKKKKQLLKQFLTYFISVETSH